MNKYTHDSQSAFFIHTAQNRVFKCLSLQSRSWVYRNPIGPILVIHDSKYNGEILLTILLAVRLKDVWKHNGMLLFMFDIETYYSRTSYTDSLISIGFRAWIGN